MTRLKRPSPALVISILALVAALVVPAYAALNKKDKKTVKNLANTEITKRAPGLAVASANRPKRQHRRKREHGRRPERERLRCGPARRRGSR